MASPYTVIVHFDHRNKTGICSWHQQLKQSSYHSPGAGCGYKLLKSVMCQKIDFVQQLICFYTLCLLYKQISHSPLDDPEFTTDPIMFM